MSGRLMPSLRQMAAAVWNMVAVASRTVTVTTNNDKTGYTVTTVSDKTGYSLTAGSYSPIRSIQDGSTAIGSGSTSATTSITAVTIAKSMLLIRSQNLAVSSGNSQDVPYWAAITASTQVTAYKSNTNVAITIYWTVVEFY